MGGVEMTPKETAEAIEMLVDEHGNTQSVRMTHFSKPSIVDLKELAKAYLGQ
jgi:hypothetical protein